MTQDELQDPQWNEDTARYISTRVANFSASQGFDRFQTNTFEAQSYIKILGYVGNPGIVPAVRQIIEEIRSAKKSTPYALVLPSEIHGILDVRSGGDVAEYVKQFDKPEATRSAARGGRRPTRVTVAQTIDTVAPGSSVTGLRIDNL